MNEDKKNYETQNKKGLIFIPFFRIRKTKDNKNLLIFFTEKLCISVNIKYLEKVISNTQQLNEEAS